MASAKTFGYQSTLGVLCLEKRVVRVTVVPGDCVESAMASCQESTGLQYIAPCSSVCKGHCGLCMVTPREQEL